MQKILLIIMAVALVGGCGGDPNKKANELYVEAVQLISSAEKKVDRLGGGELTSAIKDYEQALGHLQKIVVDYSKSDLAVKLVSGEMQFPQPNNPKGQKMVSLKGIKERVKYLKRLHAEGGWEAIADRKEKAAAPTKARPESKEMLAKRFLAGELTKADLEEVSLNLGENQLTEVPKGLEKLTQLTRLYLALKKLTDVKGLERLTKLMSLSLKDNQLTNVKGLENLTQLTFLGLQGNQLTSVKSLEKLTQLTMLILYDNKLTDVKGLEKLTKLEKLYLWGNQLTNVKGLEKLTQLTSLHLNDNQLTNVKGLEKLTQLIWLHLRNNPALTKAQIAELQKALPKCLILHNATLPGKIEHNAKFPGKRQDWTFWGGGKKTSHYGRGKAHKMF